MVDIFTTYNIILFISIVFNIIFIIGIRNLLKQTEQLEDDLVNYITGVTMITDSALETMENIDYRGAFKSDDEVGVVFDDLKNMVEYLNKEISEYNIESKRKDN